MSLIENWAAWKAATRALFWSFVASLIDMVATKEQAARELSILFPKRAQEMFDQGFALFRYEMLRDSWEGYWNDKPETFPQLGMFICSDWSSVPFHVVNLPHCQFEIRAVTLEYAQKYLAPQTLMKAAA